MLMRFVIWNLLLFLPCQLAASPAMDLSGRWNLQLRSCLPNESTCTLKLSALSAKATTVDLPANLHAQYPWFYGEMLLTRTFEHQPKNGAELPNLLILGSIGSVDETRINGVLIGKEGAHGPGSVISAWNKVRAYEIPGGLLKTGQNTIEVRIIVLDYKAGIHAGPLQVTNALSAQFELFGMRIWREYIFQAIPLLLIVVMAAFPMVITFWQKDQGNLFLVLAFFAYLIHSVYYFPIPLPVDYIIFAKTQWIARIWSVMFSALYFARNMDYFRWKHEFLWIALGLMLSGSTIFVSDLYSFHTNMYWSQIAFLTHLLYPFLFYRTAMSGAHRLIYRRYLPQSLVVLSVYLHDCFVIGYTINTPWLYHYMSIFNVIHFIDHFSFHLYMWRERGRHDAETEHMRDKLRMAHELHDVVGAELSQIVVLSQQENPSAQKAALSSLASSALEKIRDFAHILKGERQIDELPEIVAKLTQRLRALRRYEIVYLANPHQVQLQQATDLHEVIGHNNDTSDLPDLSPFMRMHIERILSEWTSNVIRHARSTKRLVVGWQMSKKKLRIFFFQDATPFEWRGHAEKGGLRSLELRAQELGGAISCRNRYAGALWLLAIPLEA